MCRVWCGLHLHSVQEVVWFVSSRFPAGLPSAMKSSDYVTEAIFSTQITMGWRCLQLGIIVDTIITMEIND